MIQDYDAMYALDEAGEDRLKTLISEAGEEARTRRRDALVRHMAMLQAAISDALARPHSAPSK